jgi:hypothetical protein
MATRQQRLDAFVHEGEPPADRRLELLCEDHVGTYVLPFLCRWSSGDWESVETGERIEAVVIGMSARWRERNWDPTFSTSVRSKYRSLGVSVGCFLDG